MFTRVLSQRKHSLRLYPGLMRGLTIPLHPLTCIGACVVFKGWTYPEIVKIESELEVS